MRVNARAVRRCDLTVRLGASMHLIMGMEHASVARVSSWMVAALAEGCHAGVMLQPLDVPFGATAQRPDWADLPPPVRSRIVAALGSAVVSADSQRSVSRPGSHPGCGWPMAAQFSRRRLTPAIRGSSMPVSYTHLTLPTTPYV